MRLIANPDLYPTPLDRISHGLSNCFFCGQQSWAVILLIRHRTICSAGETSRFTMTGRSRSEFHPTNTKVCA
ncbi:hypothetical protein M407DRAFT_244676 [Tulasnella calospora MUT 4182]|uniref:Uncharacterized protein n=1 Tax=Tulasnella calospora MUT 4182 TaxID=1051891 RepID=A0A0C3Q4A0_9AGAM|nr:hypothetical protein M407DRAFT_244676 [Tulasnella calospora MUT 4182]